MGRYTVLEILYFEVKSYSYANTDTNMYIER